MDKKRWMLVTDAHYASHEHHYITGIPLYNHAGNPSVREATKKAISFMEDDASNVLLI